MKVLTIMNHMNQFAIIKHHKPLVLVLNSSLSMIPYHYEKWITIRLKH